MQRYYWLVVNVDEYELPLAVAESAEELARMWGVSRSTVMTCEMRGRGGRECGYKYVKVEREE